MIELPEALTLARQSNAALTGKHVVRVLPPTKPHKFCWWNGSPEDYAAQLVNSTITGVEGFGIFAELTFDNGKRLCVNDGVNLRLVTDVPREYQLLLGFDDGTALALSVAMYGGIVLHCGDYDNAYYRKSRTGISPFSADFAAYYSATLGDCKPGMSAKAFLATRQRFPGLGNGVLQDILFTAGIHPKRRLSTLGATEREKLLHCTVAVLREMTDSGGRDTEKDLFGAVGGYTTKLSRNTLETGCPRCGGTIVKEAYLGGSVYYCPHCQPLAAEA